MAYPTQTAAMEDLDTFDVQRIREDFPILHQKVYGKPLVYLDNGATTQKPSVVIDTIADFYRQRNSNIHRGVHYLSDQATTAFEDARKTVRRFINAPHERQIIFTRGTTESINLVAFSFGERFVNAGDEILVSEMEHHSNIVPWQMLCERRGAKLRVIPFDDKGELVWEKFEELLNPRVKMVAITFVSNSLGTVNPIARIVEKAHAVGAAVLVDAAQAVQHKVVDVQALDCDFLAFSGHKVYASTGIGVLYGKEKWLERMPPYQGGGDMIKSVSFEKTVFNELPFKFEAGTVDYVAAISLGTAIDYLEGIGLERVEAYEDQLLRYATERITSLGDLRLFGQAREKAGSVSFLFDGIHHYDTGLMVDKMGVALRTGTHCTEPVMQHFGVTGTVRASFALYNTFEEIDILVEALARVKRMF